MKIYQSRLLSCEIRKKIVRHRAWLRDKCYGKRADLSRTHLSRVNLNRANLNRADLDFSCLPLWCGAKFKADQKICKQLVSHVLRIMELSGEGGDELLSAMREYKSGWHREAEFGV